MPKLEKNIQKTENWLQKIENYSARTVLLKINMPLLLTKKNILKVAQSL